MCGGRLYLVFSVYPLTQSSIILIMNFNSTIFSSIKMYRSHKINSVSNIAKLNDKVHFSSGGNLYTFDENNKTALFISQEDEIQYIEACGSNRIILNEKRIYKDGDLEIQFDNESQAINSFCNNLVLRDIDFENEKISFYIFYPDKEKVKLDINQENKVLTVSNNVLVFSSINDGCKFIEFFDLNSMTRMNKIYFSDILGSNDLVMYGNPVVVDNKLFIYFFDRTRKSNDKKTLCFDIGNGELLWENNILSGWLTGSPDKIFSVRSKLVQVLSSDTLELTEICLEETLSVFEYRIIDGGVLACDVSFSLSDSVYKIYDNYLYFSQKNGNVIGIIDLASKKLVWHTKLEIDSGDFIPMVTAIESMDNCLYVLDSGNTLHVFEKEIVA